MNGSTLARAYHDHRSTISAALSGLPQPPPRSQTKISKRMDTKQPYSQDPMTRCRTLVMLLTLTTTLNNHSWDSLTDLTGKPFSDRYPLTGRFTLDELRDLRILQAWAAVSVRVNKEITAAGACGGHHDSTATTNPESKKAGSLDSKSECQGNCNGASTLTHLQKIAIAANPDSEDTHVSSMDANQHVACISGESFWLSVLENPWDVLGKR